MNGNGSEVSSIRTDNLRLEGTNLPFSIAKPPSQSPGAEMNVGVTSAVSSGASSQPSRIETIWELPRTQSFIRSFVMLFVSASQYHTRLDWVLVRFNHSSFQEVVGAGKKPCRGATPPWGFSQSILGRARFSLQGGGRCSNRISGLAVLA